MKPNPFIKCFDILCLEQYITDKQSNMSKEISDTDSVNSELNTSICYSSNVSSNSDTDKDSKGKQISKNTNCMNSLTNTPHNTLQKSTPDEITSTHYINMVTDNMTNVNTADLELNCNELTSTNQDTNTHYVNMVTDNITNIDTVDSELNF